MSRNEAPPKAVIFGCAGPELTDGEGRLFAAADPLGFILFARNCRSRPQVRALVIALREAVGRADAPVLIDQEGGRVARLTAPEWRAAPPAARFGALAADDLAKGREATRLNHRLMAADLAEIGIGVDCAPVLDVPAPDASEVIGDRAFAADPALVAALGRAACDGLLAGAVLPVIKHIPGHGRARADSHRELPVVTAGRGALAASDFAPFAALAAMPWAMTAHVVYAAIDAERPATLSPTVIEQAIRGEIGFSGVLVSDDIGMGALAGALPARAEAALAAGCDVTLHCSGAIEEMEAVAAAVPPITAAAANRLAAAAARLAAPEPFDRDAGERRLAALLG